MKTGLISLATILLLIGIFLLAVRVFFSMSIPDLGVANIDVICIFIPVVCIVFGIVLFILGMRATDLHITQEGITQKDDATVDALKMLDARFTKGEITKEQYNEMKRELKK
jgi:uncharacterized membrane protein